MALFPVKFSDYMKKHVHFTKIDANTWLVQSNPNSRCESYYVTVLVNAIVMYGDYDGVIVKPHECGRENLICWMANATTQSYFIEKVHNGNQHHETSVFDVETCLNTILEHWMDRFEIDYDFKPFFKDAVSNRLSYDNIRKDFESKLSRMLECHEDNLEDTYNRKCGYKPSSHNSEVNYKAMINMLDDVLEASFENEWEFADWMHTHEFYDVERYDYSTYTHQILWQHECLLWWARHILDEELSKVVEPDGIEEGLQ